MDIHTGRGAIHLAICSGSMHNMEFARAEAVNSRLLSPRG